MATPGKSGVLRGSRGSDLPGTPAAAGRRALSIGRVVSGWQPGGWHRAATSGRAAAAVLRVHVCARFVCALWCVRHVVHCGRAVYHLTRRSRDAAFPWTSATNSAIGSRKTEAFACGLLCVQERPLLDVLLSLCSRQWSTLCLRKALFSEQKAFPSLMCCWLCARGSGPFLDGSVLMAVGFAPAEPRCISSAMASVRLRCLRLARW